MVRGEKVMPRRKMPVTFFWAPAFFIWDACRSHGNRSSCLCCRRVGRPTLHWRCSPAPISASSAVPTFRICCACLVTHRKRKRRAVNRLNSRARWPTHSPWGLPSTTRRCLAFTKEKAASLWPELTRRRNLQKVRLRLLSGDGRHPGRMGNLPVRGYYPRTREAETRPRRTEENPGGTSPAFLPWPIGRGLWMVWPDGRSTGQHSLGFRFSEQERRSVGRARVGTDSWRSPAQKREPVSIPG